MKLKGFIFLLVLGITAARPYPAAAEMPSPTRVVIDAGHGGKDFGAISPAGVREKDLVLQMAFRLRDRLLRDGMEVIMTRGSDIFVPLPVRANIANKKRADLFVSIHANASTSKTLRGFEVYTLSGDLDDETLAAERASRDGFPSDTARFYGNSASIRQIVWEMKGAVNRAYSSVSAAKIGEAVEENCDIWTKRLRPAQFQVLKRAECPAVLVELGYISNEEDERRLADDEYQTKMADAIADGIGAGTKNFCRAGECS